MQMYWEVKTNIFIIFAFRPHFFTLNITDFFRGEFVNREQYIFTASFLYYILDYG